MRILPIGSVVKAEQVKLMVVGHFSKEENNKVQYYYTTVPYPIGYVGKEKLYTIKVDADIEVLHEGFQTNDGQQHTKRLSDTASLSPLEHKLFTAVVAEAIKNLKGAQ